MKEQVFYADLAGTRTTQQRVRLQAEWTRRRRRRGERARSRRCRPQRPRSARGWEYVAGDARDGRRRPPLGLGRRARPPAATYLAEKMLAPSVEPGRYDLVIHPTNLWLTIHESIGHATELDRALGYEANYAGTSFATPGQARHAALRLRPHARDRRPRGRARAVDRRLGRRGRRRRRPWDLVSDGMLVGYQLDRGDGRRVRPPPVERLRLRRQRARTRRSSACPTSRCSPSPTAPTSTA